jgi:FkbH-like protein
VIPSIRGAELMKLIEALQIIKDGPGPEAPVLPLFLACGFTPLHLTTFLKAHLQRRNPAARVEIETGLFGDLPGNLERASRSSLQGVALAVEWSDLDARLGLRQLGGWAPDSIPELVQSAAAAACRLEAGIQRLSGACPVAVSLPTLPLPPCFAGAGWQAGKAEWELRELVISLGRRLSAIPMVRLLNPQRLDDVSPPGERYDVKADLTTGFPYRVEHAAKLTALLATLLTNPSPKKALITDLDDTLWRGILGELGPQGVSWDLASHAQIHGVYQQMLAALAASGVLVGVASKNDPRLVEEVLSRPDLHVPRQRLFPVEAHWQPKSESVSRILRTWNIGPEAVVFVDDSPMELAEVANAYPQMECLAFTPKDPDSAFRLCERLRDIFGKAALSEEDRIRGESIRSSAALHAAAAVETNQDRFLEQAKAVIEFSFDKDPNDSRAFDLVNKTNQFNLNGRRFGETEWRSRMQDPRTFLMTVSYRDRFGPLGKIAVVTGCQADTHLCIETWVMSCRAFSRRIEHQCLRQLYEHFGVGEVALDYAATPRNGPIQEFLAEFGAPGPEFRLSRGRFETACPPLFHFLETPPAAG